MLVEVYRNCSPKRICQVELAENYDHKHQELVGARRHARPAPDGASTSRRR